jgi:hypothetical protein
MLQNLINAFLGCSHRRTTFPLTPGRKTVAAPGAVRLGTYVVCLDCGREFRYDWSEMRQAEPVSIRVPAGAEESYSSAKG